MEVLQLDVSGRPQSWISAKEAAVIYASDGIAWTLGDPFYVLRGGMQRRTGLQSRIELQPIVDLSYTHLTPPTICSVYNSVDDENIKKKIQIEF